MFGLDNWVPSSIKQAKMFLRDDPTHFFLFDLVVYKSGCVVVELQGTTTCLTRCMNLSWHELSKGSAIDSAMIAGERGFSVLCPLRLRVWPSPSSRLRAWQPSTLLPPLLHHHTPSTYTAAAVQFGWCKMWLIIVTGWQDASYMSSITICDEFFTEVSSWELALVGVSHLSDWITGTVRCLLVIFYRWTCTRRKEKWLVGQLKADSTRD